MTSKRSISTGRRGCQNVIRENPAPTRHSRTSTSPLYSWKLFFSDEIVHEIVVHTNEKITTFRNNFSNEILQNDTLTTDITEVCTFVGLIYARGLLGQNNVPAEKIFSYSYGHPIFTATMSNNRFRFLYQCTSFDDYSTRTERREADCFAAVRKVFELFNENCDRALIPDDLLSIDETLHPMRNRVNFKQFNPNKPAKYGVLFKSINSARYTYSFVSAPYCGKPKSEPTEEYKQRTVEVTKYMVEKLSKYTSLKGRNISFDRLYTTIPLADWLLEKDITSVGTLVANRRGLSKEFIKTAEREEFSYKVLWRKDEPHIPLHSYIVKTKSTGKRNVLLLSTLEPLLAVTHDDGKKPLKFIKFMTLRKEGQIL